MRGPNGDAITFVVDGELLTAVAGDTIASALMALGRQGFTSARDGAPRGIFCGMGTCFDCTVTVDGQRGARACVTLVAEGMRVSKG